MQFSDSIHGDGDMLFARAGPGGHFALVVVALELGGVFADEVFGGR